MIVDFRSLPVNYSCDYEPEYHDSNGLLVRSLEETTLKPFSHCIVPTSLYIEIPQGYEGRICPLNDKYCIANTSIHGNSDVSISIYNHNDSITILKGECIAQIIISACFVAKLNKIQKPSSKEN